ncbi:hypothetical protein RHGRI_006329 [Rhododendron griersonianum]|uniref:AAA+ ATPase domain-containing protein n=1 Tax=Rhododendron griersonianum TaxID=479676 RepID=A0AAV6KSP6_9ERIC|nr:hypothetical protein RHGRI_006329 [Rhododendron griersonianum]
MGGLAFEEVIRAGKYVRHYTKNLQKLKDKLKDLVDCTETITREVSEAIGRSDEIEVNVPHWRTDADSLKDDIEQLIGESTTKASISCIACSCPNIVWQYKFSKEAEEKIADVVELIGKYNNFNHQISHPRPRPPELESLSDKNYVNFDSRASIFKDIMDALKDSNVNMIGVFGLGGVGKTTLVKEVAEQMRKDGTFKQVAMAVVSKDLNVKEVQSKLADSLNFEFKAKADDQERRATELWNKFTNGDKYLIILDDIWEGVKMEAIGIPCTNEKKGCKVVLTSRKENLLSTEMEVDRNFSIAILSSAEAWTLFMKKVGNSIQSQLEIKSLAYEVCERCKGLPVAINALGEALKGKQEHAWKTALNKLDKYMLKNIVDINPSVFASLKVSYDMLHPADAKSCFLLCCLFAEDAEIPLDELTRFWFAGSFLAQKPCTLEEARNEVYTVVDALKSASLLSNGNDENVVKIHDVIRDVGISIAREEEAFLVDHGALRWPQNPQNGPSLEGIQLRNEFIPLVYKAEVLVLKPESFVHPLQFNKFNKLTVLIIKHFKLKYLLSPTTARGLVYLEVLEVTSGEIMEGVVGFEEQQDENEITGEVKFSKLKELKLSSLPNLISFFAKKEEMGTTMGSFSARAQPLFNELVIFPVLEELTIDGLGSIIKIWDKQSVAVLEDQGSFCQLTDLEVKSCSKLMHVFPSNMHPLLKNLEELNVEECETMKGIAEFEGEIDEDGLRNEVAASLALEVEDKQPLPEPKKEVESLCKLMDICIENCGQLLYVFPSHMLPQNLQELRIQECDELEVIFSKEQKEKEAINNAIIVFPRLKGVTLRTLHKITGIWDDQPLSEPEKEAKSFSKLKDIIVHGCDQLEYVLPSYMLPQLKNLQELKIWYCTKVEVIISNNPKEKEATNNNDTIRFPQLKTLELLYLPNLKSFICSDETQSIFSNKVIFPVLESLIINGLDNIITIWDKQSITHVLEEQGSFCQLKSMDVRKCANLMYVFPSNMHPQLKNLERLVVYMCETMKGIAEFEGEIDEDGLRNEVAASLALEVEHLEMVGVPKITEIRDKQPLPEPKKEVEFLCKLMYICIEKCDQLVYVFPSHMLPQNLQNLRIQHCDELEVIISKELKEKEAINNDIIVFPQLQKVTLWTLCKLKSFYTETQGSFFSHKVVFPVLKSMNFWNLDKITGIWDDQPLSEPEKEAKSFSKLEDIIVHGCDQLEHVLPSYMLPQLKNLQELRIRNCTKVEVIISNNPKEKEATNNNDTIRFPQLNVVSLRWLPNLISFICSDEMQLFFSNKDAFPVLELLDLGNDFEFLRNETSTKEVSIEECGTSGKESDYNVEELDEDLETLTQENNKMAGTSPAQARKGKDIQEIPWEWLNITREKYRQTRLEQYKNYEDIPQSGARSEKDCKVTIKGGMYYEFRRNSRSVKSTIPHFQCRNLVWATSKQDVYFMSHFSVTHWSALTCNKTEVLNFSGHVAPCEKHPGSRVEGFTQTKVSTIAVKDRLLVAGGFQGELICKNLDRPGVCFCTRTCTTYDDNNAPTNVVEIYSTQSGAVHLTVANNDGGVRDFDMEKFQLSKHFSFPWPVNHTSMSPDGKLRIIVGDNPEGMLVDSGTGKMVASLVGHLDFLSASAWHPNGLTFATGNQDKTCRIWDARNLSKSVVALKGNLGAIRSIRYSSDGRFMAMAEPADFVHVFDTKSGYEKEQEIDFFGEISGMSFSPDTESLFIGVCDPTYGSLLEFGRRRNNSCSDSII